MQIFLLLLFIVVALIAFEAVRRSRQLPRRRRTFTVGHDEDETDDPQIKFKRPKRRYR